MVNKLIINKLLIVFTLRLQLGQSAVDERDEREVERQVVLRP